MKHLRLLMTFALLVLLAVSLAACSGDATEEPTETPVEATEEMVEEPTEAPTEVPTDEPTEAPTEAPTEVPTEAPTEAPTEVPTDEPTVAPTEAPTDVPEEEAEAQEATEEMDEDSEEMEATEEMSEEMDEEMVMMGDYETCPAPENLPETVTIGAIFGLSGDISVYGGVQQQGVDLAVAQINEHEYLGEGVTLAVQYEDAVSADDAINAMTRLVEEAEVPIVIGPTLSTHAFAADPIAQENGVPVLGVSNTASGITEMGDFVFRNSLPESSVIPGTIAQSAAILGYTNVGILYGDDDDFTLSGYEVFVDALDENGIEILGEETFAREDVDFNAQLSNLLADEPEALVVSALAAEAVQIISQARALGYEGPIIGGNGLNSPAIIANAGDDSEGVIVGAAWNIGSSNPLSVQFVADFEAAYDGSPDQFATQAYTGAWLIATAIRCADSVDPAEIRDALTGIADFASPLGAFSFAEDRNPIHDPVVQVIEDGAFGVLGAEMEESE